MEVMILEAPAALPLPVTAGLPAAWREALARHGRAVLLACVLAGAVVLPYVYAQTRSAATADPRALERNVKAAFLYKFMSYVEWPADVPVMTIGVIGADDMAAALTAVTAGRTINGKALVVRQLADNDPLTGVQAIFVDGLDGPQLSAVLRRAQQRSVLSVTDDAGGLARGSVIGFRVLEGRVRFDVSLEAAERSGLRLSSRMLAVAHQVQKGAQ
jgi:ABC-type sugar transport system substrate-binding protein